ncbi:type VI secretion system tip protein VgrG [Luteimonas sp. Y-2-2-4F]|nr:type VI secretion system tip protein TssI/VgrG [Luteimonas sp. Y-2-2-4F]MCD9033575.1 type VI secretion system tip protein VgrG [Luteimonas sp. Y-2-2-4F]
MAAMARIFTLQSDLGDALLFAAMDADERLGALYAYRVVALGRDPALDLAGLLGQPMAVRMQLPDAPERWFHGIVVEAAQDGFEVVERLSWARYALTLAPRPWLLTQRRASRVFAERSVPEIVRAVLAEIGYSDVRLSLSGRYPAREYCVQYREDDFAFVSRLMQQEGIYYYFAHEAGKHTMVLADGIGAHAAARGAESLPYLEPGRARSRVLAGVEDWRPSSAAHTTVCRLTDYDPLNPRASLEGRAEAEQGTPLHAIDGLEAFDFPGGHALAEEGSRYAQVRVEARNAERARFSGRTAAGGLATGALFRLADSPGGQWDREYLATACRLRLREADYASGDGDDEPPFACAFEAIDARLPYRSPATAPRPAIAGLQTATVTDASGAGEDEAIAVDAHGRVHVVFHWSRSAAQQDRAHSCPVRVATCWAGKQWGALHIPRVGQEVVVSFLEGDPDRPLIIGGVYNATHAPPYALPAEKTRSGIRSRSEGGGAEDFNEIRFEDKLGSEELFLHAQRDLREEVEHDRLREVGHDETAGIGNDQALEVGRDRRQEIGRDDLLDVAANGTTTIGRKFKLDAGTEIELVTGQSSLVMKSSGEIELRGIDVTIVGRNAVEVEGGVEVAVKAGATMNLKSGATLALKSDAMLSAEGGASAAVKAPMLDLKAQGIAQMSAPLIKIG